MSSWYMQNICILVNSRQRWFLSLYCVFILEWHRIITVNSHQAVFTVYVLKWRDNWTFWSTGNFDALNRFLLLLTSFECHFISSRQIKASCINEDFTGLFCEGNRVSCLYICDVNQPNRYWLLDTTRHLSCIDSDFVFWPSAIQERHYS